MRPEIDASRIAASYAAAWAELNQRLKIRHDSAVQFAAYCLVPIVTAVLTGRVTTGAIVTPWVVAAAFAMMPAIGAFLLVTSYCHNDWRIGTLNRFCALCELRISTLSWHSLSETEDRRYAVRPLPPFSPLCRVGFILSFAFIVLFCWTVAIVVFFENPRPSVWGALAFVGAMMLSLATCAIATYLLLLTHALRSRLVSPDLMFGLENRGSEIASSGDSPVAPASNDAAATEWILASQHSLDDAPSRNRDYFRWLRPGAWECFLATEARLTADYWLREVPKSTKSAEQSDATEASTPG